MRQQFGKPVSQGRRSTAGQASSGTQVRINAVDALFDWRMGLEEGLPGVAAAGEEHMAGAARASSLTRNHSWQRGCWWQE
jgi:hypothetical protein